MMLPMHLSNNHQNKGMQAKINVTGSAKTLHVRMQILT